MPAAATALAFAAVSQKVTVPQLSPLQMQPRTIVITKNKHSKALQDLFTSQGSGESLLEGTSKTDAFQPQASSDEGRNEAEVLSPQDTPTHSLDLSANSEGVGKAHPSVTQSFPIGVDKPKASKDGTFAAVAEKACGRCGIVKPAVHYHLNRSKPTGLGSWCKQCTVLWYKTKPRHEPQVATKKCTGCGIVKPADKFHRQSRLPTGLRIYCKDCEHVRYSKKTKVETPTVAEKRCTKCQAVKPAADFHKQRNVSTGLHSWCKHCVAEDYAQHPRRKRSAVPQSKMCEACGVQKPALAFRRDRSTPDGLHVWCKHCNDSRVGRTPQRLQAQPPSRPSGAVAAGGNTPPSSASPLANDSLLRPSYESAATRAESIQSQLATLSTTTFAGDSVPWPSCMDQAPVSAFTRCLPSLQQQQQQADLLRGLDLVSLRLPHQPADNAVAIPMTHAPRTISSLGIPLGLGPATQVILSKHGLPSAFAAATPAASAAVSSLPAYASSGQDAALLGTTVVALGGLPTDLSAAIDAVPSGELDEGTWGGFGLLPAQGKVCSHCSRLRPLSLFYVDPASADGSGLAPWCTPCVQAALAGHVPR